MVRSLLFNKDISGTVFVPNNSLYIYAFPFSLFFHHHLFQHLPMAEQYMMPTCLIEKKCVPCNLKELRPMDEDVAHTLMPQVEKWNLVNESGVLKLRQSWTVKSFTKGLEFFKIVANLAENEGHHPDLHLVNWNNVTIEIWTHACGGLTENDFILAAKIDKLNLLEQIRRKPSE
ncbi:hypothetical protein Lal_00006807 [Lupinus albus]|uniref:4a-hydroxytetrahydrobiopterin dehydratase n=1 Tax=Lupinus albus TaxID=3870 RepID=A0A6A5MP10_LUPAL|nr:putative 4a-hydroxytetrahydrobiopterin dehydratase transcription coactivator Tc-PD family [Lupinus albus]KAF1876176.1 hypothetical protein Lal_00006807 [Lupinus albus]